MKREHIVNPDDFESIEGKMRVVHESLDGLLEGTERFRQTKDIADILATIVASLIALHQVVGQMLADDVGREP
jgi:hypothetical protein